MKLGIILYIIGLVGYFINRRNYIYMILALELMLLAIAYILLYKANIMNDLVYLNYTLFILILAGVETAVGLTLFIQFYSIKNTLDF